MCRILARQSYFVGAALLAAVSSGAWWSSASALTLTVESNAIASGTIRATRVAQLIKSYKIFFDYKRADLNDVAAQYLDKFVAEIKTGGVTKVEVVGHTDKAASDAESKVLSKKRADVVKAALIARGIPGSAITSVGAGKSRPTVQTPDGQRDPQNRRAEIRAYK